MEQGFQDVCLPLCQGQKPTNAVASACKNAAMEMPRPTVRRWCEHGYVKAWEKAQKDLRTHFVKEDKSSESAAAESSKPAREVLVTIPVTIDDKVFDLQVLKGQGAEEAVVLFCQEFMSEDTAACARQLLPVAIEKVEALEAGSN